MKIIKQGALPSKRIWIGECRNCKSEAECEQSELRSINEGDYRSEGPFCWQKCPVCGHGADGSSGMIFHPKKSTED
jgi:hypothetical protein